MNQKSDSSDQHSEAAWQHRAEMALASVIAADRLITYAELADAANIPPPHRIHKLTLWLETKLVADHQAGAELRTARVISRSRGVCQLRAFSSNAANWDFMTAQPPVPGHRHFT